ncbi:hypothetical protein [endosymbiont GvMRE of Glomus versiforme]|uniref:hypothetical protein n=1 Tax=endosymbiont GvMRE of Glomus versiforme TaxID=2039283 RepID=UPI000EE302C2|nr:hypothetical protein [endosymbiont GvMRE of Glomus versiforme]RHZ37567.1 hypothetical protein GvMRE_I1g366 [endosymbiont GvMRE of Glomus versiforme]
MNNPNYGERERESKNSRKWLWIILGIVVLAIGIIAIVFWQKNNPKNPTQKTTKEANSPKIPGHIAFEFEEINNQAINSQLAAPETYILLEHRWKDNK